MRSRDARLASLQCRRTSCSCGSWTSSRRTLDDLGSKMNRKKIETLITIQVHQRDVFAELTKLYKERKISGPSDFEWLKQARLEPEVNDLLQTRRAQLSSLSAMWITIATSTLVARRGSSSRF